MKNMKKLILLLGAGVLAGTLSGCGSEEPIVESSIKLNCSSEETKLERHQSVQFSVELSAVKAEDVVYNVSSDAASIDASGKLTVSDTAEVGATFTVSASAGDVISNEYSFEVKDTIPESIRITPSQTSIKNGDKISFDARFYPNYATLTDFELEILENGDIAEIVDKKLQLKDGVDFLDHLGKQIKVRATLKADESKKHEVAIAVGDVKGSLLVSNVDIIARKQADFTVNPTVYDENGKRVANPTLPFIYSSSKEDIFVVSDNGVITAKGHGTAELKVKYGELEATSTVNVILSPQSIAVNGITPVIDGGSFKFAKDAEFTLDLSSTKESQWTKVSDKYKYDLKLFNKDTSELITDDDDAIASINGNKFVFKQVGLVQLDIKSDSSLNDVVVSDTYECDTTLRFDVNAGKNVSNYAEFQAALKDENCVDVNFVNSLVFKTSDLEKDSNGIYVGNRSNGNKTLNGNGFELNFAGVDLNTTDVTSDGLRGGNFVDFYPCADETSDKNHKPFTVNIHDLAVIGNTDYNGFYNGTGSTPKTTSAFSKYGKFVGFYRTAFNLGDLNTRYNWVTDGNVNNQAYWGSYVDSPNITNLDISGFYWGLWCHQVVDGYFSNIHTVDQAEKGILSEQSTITLNNPSFDKNGAFCIELTQDGINNMQNVSAPSTDLEQYYHREPCAGAHYNEPSKINMTGTIRVNNYSNGVDTAYLQGFAAELQTMGVESINSLIDMILVGTAQAIAAQIKAAYSVDLDYTALVTFGKNIIFDNDLVNFFALSFMQDLALSSYGEKVADYAVIQEDGEDAITMQDIMIKEATALLQGGHDLSYKTHKYINFELETGATAGNLGTAVVCNCDYTPAN